MNSEQTITHVEQVSTVLAQLRQQVERLVGRLADAELQLADVRTERDEEHKLAETLKTALANSAAIEQAIGIIAEKAHIDVTEARARLKSYSRDHDQKMRAVAQRLVAGVDPKSASYGDPEMDRLIAEVGVPLEFWTALTLNGAIFK